MVKSNNTNSFQEGVDENPLCAMILGSMKKFRKNLAFTLAEVLITLGIIGIVAAMVIPSLINAYQKHVTVTRLKQTYAQITQAVKLSEADNGDITGWDMGTATLHKRAEGIEFANKYILPYLKYSYICNNTKSYCNDIIIKNIKGDNTDSAFKNDFAIALMNGTIIRLDPRDTYTFITVHINGGSSSNIIGKNVFSLLLKKDLKISNYVIVKEPGIYFMGEGYTREYLTSSGYSRYLCSKQGALFAGNYCGALIKLDGWKISKDYPW